MPTTRKKREAKQPSIDTSNLKKFAGGDSSSKHERRMGFAKRVKEESEDIQEQISSEQEKAGKRSLWSSIGGALAGLGAGIATGGASWAVQGAAVGLGTYLGAHGGKTAAEDPNVGKAGRKKIKSDMFYESEAEKQNLAFRDFETKLNEGILNRSLAAGLLTAAVAGGGKLIEKMKVAKAAKIAKEAEEARKAMGIPGALKQAQEGFQTILASEKFSKAAVSTSEAVASATNIVKPKTVGEGMKMLKGITQEYSGGQAIAPESQFGEVMALKTGGGELAKSEVALDLKDMSWATKKLKEISPSEGSYFSAERMSERHLSKYPRGVSAKSQLASFTPFSSEAAPTIMKSYLSGMKGMASDYAKKSILASGAMGIYGYRPEMESLRSIQMITSPYQTQQRTRTV